MSRKSVDLECPNCQGKEVPVIDSRPQRSYVYRRRKCESCDYRWVTLEVRKSTMDMLAIGWKAADL